MRQKVCDALVARAGRPDMVFLTGDLGFMALEPLQAALGDRFINCGVAEQNMISVAAAMAKDKLDVWIYTIAPFCYARAFEQIRNDICMHALPVKMLCNGGGYGYGVMGATHHAIEDYGVLSTLPGLRIYTPAAHTDILPVVEAAGRNLNPCYIRLGRDERPAGLDMPAYAPWRCLTRGDGPVVISLGPIAGPVHAALAALEDGIRPEFWVVSELPLIREHVPEELKQRIATSGRVCVIEEHVAHGGLGSMLCQWFAASGLHVRHYRHLHAATSASPLTGSQTYLRNEHGLGAASIQNAVRELIQNP
jgi:transketolase